jgi:hypothetical protein
LEFKLTGIWVGTLRECPTDESHIDLHGGHISGEFEQAAFGIVAEMIEDDNLGRGCGLHDRQKRDQKERSCEQLCMRHHRSLELQRQHGDIVILPELLASFIIESASR